MKKFFPVISILISFYIVSSWAVFGQSFPDEPLISLEVKNGSLGLVLDEISRETGYSFKVDNSWKNHPVKASLHKVPLNRALKRILGTLNHAIVYESDTQIRIEIYGEATPRSNGASAPSYKAPNPPVEDPPEPQVEEPPAPEPESVEKQPPEEKKQSETNQEATEKKKAESNTNDQSQEIRSKVNSD